jgi:hypothetical protein
MRGKGGERRVKEGREEGGRGVMHRKELEGEERK